MFYNYQSIINKTKKGAIMNSTTKNIDFQGQIFFIGLDVHKKNWSVTIRTQNIHIKTLSMNPSPTELNQHLQKNYPGGTYHSVYEAGFCGFWIHRELESLGIHNIVIHPGDVPTTEKEKRTKTDPVDSAKLARELSSGSLEAIYVPDRFHDSFRSLVRLRHKLVRQQSRIKNRIKSYLYYLGIQWPIDMDTSNWPNRFLTWLENISFEHQPSKDYMTFCLQDLAYTQQQIQRIQDQIEKYIQQEPLNSIIKKQLMSVPGVGFTTAVTLYAELIDIYRFPSFDKLAAFVGFVPNTHSSGEKEKTTGITHRQNRYLRHYLIEAAWIAIKKDPALLLAFGQLKKHMTSQEAIVRIGKKLLNRIRHVWKNKQSYVEAVV